MVELIATLVVLAVLASVAVLYFRSQVTHAQDARVMDAQVKLVHVAASRAVGQTLDSAHVASVLAARAGEDPDLRLAGRSARAVFVVPSAQSDPATASSDPSVFSVALGQSADRPKPARVAAVAMLSDSGNCVLSVLSDTGTLLKSDALPPTAGGFSSSSSASPVPCSGAAALSTLLPSDSLVEPSAVPLAPSSPSSPSSAPVSDRLLPPSQVINAHVAADAGSSADLAWSPPVSGGPVADYRVVAYPFDPVTSTRSSQPDVEVVVADPAAAVASLDAATSYQMDVFARNAAGSSDPVTLTLAPPPAPTGLKAVGSLGQVALTWDAVPGAVSYRVYRPGANAKAFARAVDSSLPASWDVPLSHFQPATAQVYAQVSAPAAVFFDPVPSSNRYMYSVSAVNARGESLSLERVSVSAVRSGAPLADLLGQGSAMVCKFASASGGLFFLPMPQTRGWSSPIAYTVSTQAGSLSGVFDPSSGAPGVLLSIPTNTVDTVTLRDAASGVVVGIKTGTGTVSVAQHGLCP